MTITNLEELKTVTSEHSIKMIVTEYMSETIVKANIFDKFEHSIKNKSDATTLTVGEIKEILANFANEMISVDV